MLTHPQALAIEAIASRRITSDADLYALLKPYEGYRVSQTPATTLVDVRSPGINRVGADIRKVTREGVEFCRAFTSPEFVPFADITTVKVRAVTLYETLATETWERVSPIAATPVGMAA